MIILKIKKHLNDKSRQAFSLVELSIVLCVMAAILGGIWQLVDTAWEASHREQTREAVITTVTAMRELYAGQLSMNSANPANPVKVNNLIPLLVSQNVIPSYLVRANETGCTNSNPSVVGNVCADTPFGQPSTTTDPSLLTEGTFRVCNWAAGQTACDTNVNNISFAVQLLGLDDGSCIQLGANLSSPTGPTGLLDVIINGADVYPVTSTTLNTKCQYGNDNWIAFVYRLTPSN